MPFTLSHVAAVLPLRGRCRRDLFAAAAIGSMMPDLPYFLPGLRMHWPIPSHQLISLPLFCLPIGWLLWWLWRPCWNASGDRPCSAPPANWRVLAALAVGALSHLAWDACTHASYGLGRWWPALGFPLFRLGDVGISGAVLLQYLSSIAGLLLLAVAAWPTRQRLWENLRSHWQMRNLLTALVFIGATTALATFAMAWQTGRGTNELRHLIRLTAWNGVAAPLALGMLYPLLWRLRQRKFASAHDRRSVGQ